MITREQSAEIITKIILEDMKLGRDAALLLPAVIRIIESCCVDQQPDESDTKAARKKERHAEIIDILDAIQDYMNAEDLE